MALNTSKCNDLTPVHFKGLITTVTSEVGIFLFGLNRSNLIEKNHRFGTTCGCSQSGPVADSMRHNRATYHCAIHKVKCNEKLIGGPLFWDTVYV